MKGFGNILKYLTGDNIVVTILITVISNYIFDVVSTFITYIVLPFVDAKKINQKNEKGEFKNLNEYTVKVNDKVNLHMGYFLRSLIKFVLMLVIMFIFIGLVKSNK
jgi:large-conductance mechanosensitive channel